VSEPIISVSGLRGIVGDSLTPEVAIRYVAAFVARLSPGPIVVTRDGRATGPMVAAAVQSALMAAGRTCLDGGIAATPTCGVLVRQHKAAGGIQITASHNPPPYNGLKLFNADGRVIPSSEGAPIVAAYREREACWVPHDKLGKVELITDSAEHHLSLIEKCVDFERIRAAKFNVVLDSNHGSGSILARKLLERLGCSVTILGESPDGHFAHPPEPTAQNLESVLSAVTENSAQIGFCQDPDADRLAVIDESGNYLGEEYTLAIAVDHVLRKKKGPVVTNCSTSRMTQDIAERHGVPFARAAVGEANVVDTMLARDAVIGGEGNGGVIDPRIVLVRDSFIGMALLLEAMAERELPISGLAAEITPYSIYTTKTPLPAEKIDAGLGLIEKHFSDATADRMDGLRLDWPGKWLLIRASNTEPIVRIVAEAESQAEAERLCEEAAEVLKRV